MRAFGTFLLFVLGLVVGASFAFYFGGFFGAGQAELEQAQEQLASATAQVEELSVELET